MRKFLLPWVAAMLAATSTFLFAQEAMVMVTVENIAPADGVALTPVWVGFHSGNFDSYNGGLPALEGLERVAEDGDNSLISSQFLDFDPERGGYTYIDNSQGEPQSRLVRTGELGDVFRQDATLSDGPLLPGQSASEVFPLRTDGTNDYFSYAAMVLPTNDFFVANGNPLAHDISDILESGGEISFFIGVPNSGVNDAGTEPEDFTTSAGNGLFPGRNLPEGQTGPNQGETTSNPIASVVADPFVDFEVGGEGDGSDSDQILEAVDRLERRLVYLNRFRHIPFVRVLIREVTAEIEDLLSRIEGDVVDLEGLDFNQYADGIARVTITVLAPAQPNFTARVRRVRVADSQAFLDAATAGNLYFNVHTADFPGGEIRGQLDTVVARRRFRRGGRSVTLAAQLDGAQEPNNASDSTATGEARVTIHISRSGRVRYSAALSVDGIAVDDLIPVATFSAIHIHNAPRGENGPVLQDVIVDAGGSPTDFSVLREGDR